VSDRVNILVAGVGGQGTLLASDILAEVGMRAGLDSKKSDVLGLSVRGGSVLSHVRWGTDIASPVVRTGDMGYMLAFEPLEALRGIPLMRSSGTIVCNTQTVSPISVSSGEAVYPDWETIESALRAAAATVRFVRATELAVEIGTPKVTNVVMLGAFSAMFDIDDDVWEDVVLGRVPAKYAELNRSAFLRGREVIREESA
jgi:indolepyruvate ferredoxin oxidoreductase beta subunit